MVLTNVTEAVADVLMMSVLARGVVIVVIKRGCTFRVPDYHFESMVEYTHNIIIDRATQISNSWLVSREDHSFNSSFPLAKITSPATDLFHFASVNM